MPQTHPPPIVLPLQYYTLEDWLAETHIRPTAANVAALGQCIGSSLQALLRKVLSYCATAKTVGDVQVFTALKTVFGGRVPLRAIQQSRFRCNLPASTFFTCVKLTAETIDSRLARGLRWSRDAKVYIQRALEWHVRECLEDAKDLARTYCGSTEEAWRYLK